MTKISIITAVRNEQTFLDQFIESLRAQSYGHWELCIVDDGSDDRTPEIIESWMLRDSRIRAASLRVRLGKVAAFNRAFEASTGDIICLCGGDDTLPSNSLKRRVEVLSGHLDEAVVAYFKIRTFSAESKFDGAVLPRGKRGSRSGGSLTMTRPLATIAFPVPASLPAEDIWLSHAVESIASMQVDDPEVVLNYRIHSGNSNPRHQDFASMTEATHRRMYAFQELLAQDRFAIPLEKRRELRLKIHAEELRYQGRTLDILRLHGMPMIDRLGMAQGSNPRLRKLRDKAYLVASGWRGR